MEIRTQLSKIWKTYWKPKVDITDQLTGLTFPDKREPFPIYPESSWLGIRNFKGDQFIGNIYYGKGGTVFEMHVHAETYEFGEVLEGSCIIYIQGEEPLTLTAGDTYVLRPGQYHYAKWLTDCTVKFLWEPPFASNKWEWQS